MQGNLDCALSHLDGTFYSVDNTCPYADGSLGEGKLTECIVECPWHGWRFNIRTGERVEHDTTIGACYPVRIQVDQIQIALPPSLTSEPMKKAVSSADQADPALWESLHPRATRPH